MIKKIKLESGTKLNDNNKNITEINRLTLTTNRPTALGQDQEM